MNSLPARGSERAFAPSVETNALPHTAAQGAGLWHVFAICTLLIAALWHASENLPAWLRMWLLVGAEVMAVKWLMFRHATGRGIRAHIGRRLAFFLAWAGTDAGRFLRVPADAHRLAGSTREWFWAAAQLLAGVTLVLIGAGFSHSHPHTAAWLGMTGAHGFPELTRSVYEGACFGLADSMDRLCGAMQ